MDYHQRVNAARDNLDRAEKELDYYTVADPSHLAEYVRLSEAARLARKEFTDALDARQRASADQHPTHYE